MKINSPNINQYNEVTLSKVSTSNFKANYYFGNTIKNDSFENLLIKSITNENELLKNIATNADLQALLKAHKLPVVLNVIELNNLLNNHGKRTEQIAELITDNLQTNLRQRVNIQELSQGAKLHDVGKVLIPPSILDKPSTLTEEEHKIMDLHSKIGYLLLKNTNTNKNVLDLVRYHHLNSEMMKEGFYIPSIEVQILNLADKYCAMTEDRVYRKALSKEQTLNILNQEMQDGKINSLLFNALKKGIENF